MGWICLVERTVGTVPNTKTVCDLSYYSIASEIGYIREQFLKFIFVMEGPVLALILISIVGISIMVFMFSIRHAVKQLGKK